MGSRPPRRCSSRSWARVDHVRKHARVTTPSDRGQGRPRRTGHSAPPARVCACLLIWQLTGHDYLAGPRIHRSVPQSVQPAAGRAVGRRPGDGRDVALDVDRRVRRRCSGWRSLFPNPVLIIIVVFAAVETWRRLSAHRARRSRTIPRPYYKRRSRVTGRSIGAALPGARSRCSWSACTPPTCTPRCSCRHLPTSAVDKGDSRPASATDFPQLPLHLALGVPGLDRLAFVVQVLAARQRDLDLGPRARVRRSKDPGRHDASGRARGCRPFSISVELPAVQQQLARPLRAHGSPVRRRAVGRDVERR